MKRSGSIWKEVTSLSNLPVSYDFINAYNSLTSPSTVHVKNTGLAQFFKRYLLQDAMSVFEWKMPETWAENYFLTVLYTIGYIIVLDTPEFGVIPQHGGLGGYNAQYQPLYAMVSNPLIRDTLRPIIDEECVVLRLQPDYCGLFDLVDYYGDLLAMAAETAGVNIINSKLSFVFAAKNKAAAESFKKLYDQIQAGNPAAFVDKDLTDDDGHLTVEFLNQNVGQNFIADRLFDTIREIKQMFLTDIGIPNANTDKRERLISEEVRANDFETRSKCKIWLKELQKGCAKVRKMFGVDVSVDWQPELKKAMGGDTDARVDTRDL